MGYKIAACIALLIMTSGCKRGMDVAVTESPTSLTFKAMRGGQPACIDDVAIYKADDQLNPLWSIGAPDRAKCRSEFRYGEVPASFVASGEPVKLTAGHAYIVTMRGAGTVGQGEFRKRF
ncbi:hypothetical protein [Sphingomonas parapaucimobilis]|uniref:hypothetical protein n=1 Tax=Sphingomonas parapaucimobilis TaxID=28213 RepID=UPI0035C81EDC